MYLNRLYIVSSCLFSTRILRSDVRSETAVYRSHGRSDCVVRIFSRSIDKTLFLQPTDTTRIREPSSCTTAWARQENKQTVKHVIDTVNYIVNTFHLHARIFT